MVWNEIIGGVMVKYFSLAVLYCSVLYCTVLYCTLLYCTVLTVQGVTRADGGDYSCVASNKHGSAALTVHLDVFGEQPD